MTEDLFKGATLGDRFRTRDDQLAIYLQPYIPTYGRNFHILALEEKGVIHNTYFTVRVYDNGENFTKKTKYGSIDHNFDIIKKEL